MNSLTAKQTAEVLKMPLCSVYLTFKTKMHKSNDFFTGRKCLVIDIDDIDRWNDFRGGRHFDVIEERINEMLWKKIRFSGGYRNI